MGRVRWEGRLHKGHTGTARYLVPPWQEANLRITVLDALPVANHAALELEKTAAEVTEVSKPR